MKILKVIPIILAILCFARIFLLFYGINSVILSVIGHTSILSWIFFYLSSFVFKFCYYHRVPLYYIFTSLIICLYDLYIGLPVNLFLLFMIHILLFLIMVVQLTKFYLR